LRAFAFLAADVHFELITVEEAEALVDVRDADAAAVNLGESIGRNAETVVGNFDEEAAVAAMGADVNLSAFETRGGTMVDGVFDHRLEQHGGDKGVESFGFDLLEDLQLVAAETDDFDIEVVVDEIELFAERNERFVLAQELAKDVG